MKVFLVVTREYDQNCYCCFDQSTKEGVVIDPGLNHEGIVSFIRGEEIKIKYILLTHAHFDHISGASEIKDYTNAPIVGHPSDAEILYDPKLNLSGGSYGSEISLSFDYLVSDGDVIAASGIELKVVATPGHTPGGLCFYSPQDSMIFTGDTLFWESVGRTDLPLGDGRLLTRSIKEKLLTLPGDTIVYPGHGRPTDIKHERGIHQSMDSDMLRRTL
ncbi:MAG: MBL fold metallo-hydrolase [Clostridiales bacterium]|jgi:glyoxylase-like metal-dependent hydrolase (beta-lactamase superfamily II)|nr:MBL fold metallo-hydrolase [Clostridiales bacterium]